jgi:hypothetical protein
VIALSRHSPSTFLVTSCSCYGSHATQSRLVVHTTTNNTIPSHYNISMSNSMCTPSTPTPMQDTLRGFDADADTTAGTSPSLMSSPPTHRVPHKYVQLLSPPSCMSSLQEPPPPLQLHVDKHWSQVWAVHRRLIKIEAVCALFYLLVSLLLVLMHLVLPHALVVNRGADGAALCPNTQVPPCVVLQACRYKPRPPPTLQELAASTTFHP